MGQLYSTVGDTLRDTHTSRCPSARQV